MTDHSYLDRIREIEDQIAMPLSEVPIVHHHDNCGYGYIDRCTCDPDGQCNLAQTGECECGPWTDGSA